ncbi:MAG: thioesterase domain-containing protein, partial [Chthoniobacteraceae bacterium]
HVLRVEHISIYDDFFELGGHSLMAVSLFTEIEQKLGRKLPLATLFQATTLEQIASVIQQKGWTAPWSPLVPIQPLGTKEPFFCIHGADGAVLFYNKLASLFAPDQPVYGLQAQGLDGGHIVHSSMEAMAALYIKEIRAVQGKGPYFLGGYSFGGLLALEMAIQLRAQGEPVAMVALLDANNPAMPARRYTLQERIVLRTRVIAGLSLKQKIAFVLDRGWRKLKVIILLKKEALKIRVYKSKSKHKEIIPVNYRILHVREANIAAAHNYKPRIYNGALTLIRAENPNDGFEFDSKLGWGGLAAEGIEIHDVPGQHETMFHEPHVYALAKTLRDCIEKARRRFGL